MNDHVWHFQVYVSSSPPDRIHVLNLWNVPTYLRSEEIGRLFARQVDLLRLRIEAVES